MFAWGNTKQYWIFKQYDLGKCPKNVFVTKPVLQLGVNSAVIEFNEGTNGAIRVFGKLGIDIGKETAGGTAKKKKTQLRKWIWKL